MQNPLGAAMHKIAEWLEKLGMSEYAQRFAENRIDFSVLRDLTDQDLKDLGVVLGDRRKLLRAIANIDDKSPGVAPEPVLLSAGLTTAATAAAEATGERRYLTVMFCDLVGSFRTARRRGVARPSWHLSRCGFGGSD
jgi:hypothetical protein